MTNGTQKPGEYLMEKILLNNDHNKTYWVPYLLFLKFANEEGVNVDGCKVYNFMIKNSPSYYTF